MSCISPIEYFIEYVDYQKTINPTITMSDILDEVTSFSYTLDICCPDFCDDIYMLAGQGSDGLTELYTSLQCCTNLYYNIRAIENLEDEYLEDLSSVSNRFYELVRSCCNKNNTPTCVSELLEHTNSNDLRDWFYKYDPGSTNGLLEYNTINNAFVFCDLVALLKTKPPAIAEEYMLGILAKGLVISCKNGVVVSGIEKYVEEYVNTSPVP